MIIRVVNEHEHVHARTLPQGAGPPRSPLPGWAKLKIHPVASGCAHTRKKRPVSEGTKTLPVTTVVRFLKTFRGVTNRLDP
eukprot:COSAG02_NODE_2262_length_9317_cov_21.181927_15_plen_81_part_00